MSQGYKVAGGDRLGKTIVFARNQAHAEFIAQRFNVAYPEYGGEFARVRTRRTSSSSTSAATSTTSARTCPALKGRCSCGDSSPSSDGDAVAAERIREAIQAIATALLPKKTIPSVAEQLPFLDEVAGDEWWVDVTLPMLEVMRLRLRDLVRFVEKTRQSPVYTDFEDTLDEPTVVDLPQATSGMNWERFRAKAQAYLRQHRDHVALQRLRRNEQLTADDLGSLAGMLVASGGDQQVDLAWVTERAGALGPFIRSLVGLDRSAVNEAVAGFLDESKFSVEQIRSGR
ncbi:type I restriction-modification enzyme R subunit C-terminal domain-containing protein [Raineyella sp. W15-4]|uniref:type I restriction-modification enzyme R subunit C-terminal domain-containing protein n=1 Tax=Raineyella sp. W15-4 TaxID=3081651 RepID=UPI00398982CA